MSLPDRGQRILILHDLGGFTPATFEGPSKTHGPAWGLVSIQKAYRFFVSRSEPLSRLALDTPANRAAAMRSVEIMERGLSSIREARSLTATLPRLEPEKGSQPIRREA